MKQAIMTIGCSASGKSTIAYELHTQGWYRLERDVYRELVLCHKFPDFNLNHDTTNLWELWKFKWEDEVDALVDEGIKHANENGYNIICSDTNLNEPRREKLAKKLESFGYEVEYHVIGMDLSLDELWKRDTYRKNTVGHSIIAKQYSEFRKQFPKYKLKDVSDKKECIIFDVDGTLTKGPHNRSPYEWDKVHQDIHNEILFLSLIKYFDVGFEIIIMSGRDSVCMEATRDWIFKGLEKFGASDGTAFHLFMRAEGDQRKDNIVKAELFMEHVDGNYKVAAVYDDRPIMCREWLEFGFDVYCVGNQYVEF
jgi:adenylate kinase family enzyme